MDAQPQGKRVEGQNQIYQKERRCCWLVLETVYGTAMRTDMQAGIDVYIFDDLSASHI